MNEKEMQQLKQDAITLDFPRWAERQRMAKLPDDHKLRQTERDKVLDRQRRDNEAARRWHLNKREEESGAKQAESDAILEKELEPEKRRIKNEWLANHPGATAQDFEKKAWHLIRENLIEERRQNALQTDIEAARATGRYSL